MSVKPESGLGRPDAESSRWDITAAFLTDPPVTQRIELLFRPVTLTRVLSFEGLPLDDDG